MAKSRNWANYILAILFLAYLIILYLKITMPNMMWDKLQIMVDGALVGGLADWFAVKALFTKPLGFPYHTALLPRKRESFIKATIKLIEQEFLAKKKIYHLIHKLDTKALVDKILAKREMAQVLSANLTTVVAQYFAKQDAAKMATTITTYLDGKAKAGELNPLVDKLIYKVQDTNNAPQMLDFTLNYLQNYWGKDYRQGKISTKIKDYVEAKHGGMTLALAYATNAFNPEEIGELITGYSRELINYCQEKDGYMYGQLIHLINDLQRDLQEKYGEDINLLDLWQLGSEAKLSKEDFAQLVINHQATKEIIAIFIAKFQAQLTKEGPLLAQLRKLSQELILAPMVKIQGDEKLKASLAQLIKGFMQRAALGGEKWLLNLARDVLDKLGTKELNDLVYPKVRRDLIWIRLNGSVVGGLLALVYVCIETLLLK